MMLRLWLISSSRSPSQSWPWPVPELRLLPPPTPYPLSHPTLKFGVCPQVEWEKGLLMHSGVELVVQKLFPGIQIALVVPLL